MTNETTVSVPRVGMFATVRNRRGVVSSVEPYDGETGRLHLVHMEYKDDELPQQEQLIWELEPRNRLLEPTALPVVAGDPMPGQDFDALLRAARWTAARPYLDPDGEGPVERLPVSSPFHGAVQVEDYQLVPLLKALRMPRVNLLIADDVGIGKTIEAGLILSELILRRRVQRVLILTPASLRLQWRDEMWDKFSLPFDLVDRNETHRLRKRLGMDANPWRSFSRIISSYHYLRQEDVLEQFLSACRTPEGSPHLPWDLLIVDECHNLMPSAFGNDSNLCRMIRLLAPQFEHRLFLSATPHNGHTRCFTGLLEILDPVRFSQTAEMKPKEKERIQQVVLRRLKREINARTDPPKFCTRKPPKAILLRLSSSEAALSSAFVDFRTAVKKLIASGEKKRRRAGTFAVEILGKRLLSCPTAFAESWRRSKAGLGEAESASDEEVAAAERSVKEETGDDRETQKREETAAGVVGAWLKAVAEDLQGEIAAIDQAVHDVGFNLDSDDVIEQDPNTDARFEALQELLNELLIADGEWKDDERIIIFTEYKTTLDYLLRRLREVHENDRILTLFGGMDEIERDLVKRAFNDPDHPARLLLATDAAAEGLNLQRTARYLLHFDCPWNPSKLEQRNGRLDRHGQARDVTLHHFVSDQDQDLEFLSHVIRKANDAREDLGSANEIFDTATHRRLVQGDDLAEVQRDLDRQIEEARGRTVIDADDTISTGESSNSITQDLSATAAEIDLDAESLRETLESAMAIRAGRPQLSCEENGKTYRVMQPGLPGWSGVIDDSLRMSGAKNQRGPVSRMAFGPEPLLQNIGGREIFSPRPDLLLMHLSHPMLQKAMSTLTRRRFPGSDLEVSRWCVRLGEVPENTEALILLTVEELAVNKLRESFHHWVRTMIFPVVGGTLGEPLAHRAAQELRGAAPTHSDPHQQQARELLDDLEPDLRQFLTQYTENLSTDLREQLELDGDEASKQEDERYRSRQGEVSSLITENTLAKLEREVEKLETERAQGHLFGETERLDKISRSIEEKQEEMLRRTRHYEEVREQLEKERDRILKHLLPNRHAMPGEAQVFPISLEVRLPMSAGGEA
jgi:hypothetical protein